MLPEKWRKPRKGEALPDILRAQGRLPGSQRCSAIGLGHTRSACPHARWHDSAYCYYHKKLQSGLTEPDVESYPVWPLPTTGYRLLHEENLVLEAA